MTAKLLTLQCSPRKQLILKIELDAIWATCVTSLKDDKLYEELCTVRSQEGFKRKWWVTNREAVGPRAEQYMKQREKSKPIGSTVIM